MLAPSMSTRSSRRAGSDRAELQAPREENDYVPWDEVPWGEVKADLGLV
jgi:hypothetical protein